MPTFRFGLCTALRSVLKSAETIFPARAHQDRGRARGFCQADEGELAASAPVRPDKVIGSGVLAELARARPTVGDLVFSRWPSATTQRRTSSSIASACVSINVRLASLGLTTTRLVGQAPRRRARAVRPTTRLRRSRRRRGHGRLRDDGRGERSPRALARERRSRLLRRVHHAVQDRSPAGACSALARDPAEDVDARSSIRRGLRPKHASGRIRWRPRAHLRQARLRSKACVIRRPASSRPTRSAFAVGPPQQGLGRDSPAQTARHVAAGIALAEPASRGPRLPRRMRRSSDEARWPSTRRDRFGDLGGREPAGGAREGLLVDAQLCSRSSATSSCWISSPSRLWP